MPRKSATKLSRSKKITKKSTSSNHLTHWLIGLGIFLISISLSWKLYQAINLSFFQYQPPTQVNQPNQVTPTYINLPTANIKLPIADTVIHNGIWQINPNGASHLNTSASLLQTGNIIIYSHNTQDRFRRLNFANIGDVIILTGSDGKNYHYLIKSKQIVYPNQVDILAQTHGQQLILYTCTGWLDSKRLVLIATPSLSN